MADLLKGLKTQNVIRKVGGQWGIAGKKTAIDIEIRKEAHVNLDSDMWAAAVAKAITETARANMLAGMTPGGKPLPPVSASTAHRRKYREAQALRGGAPLTAAESAHVYTARRGKTRKTNVKKSTRQFTRSYKPKGAALRTQGPFIPQAGPHAGVESGLMARSIVAIPTTKLEFNVSPKPERSETLFRVYVADIRGVMDGHGTSPMARAAATGALDFTGVEAAAQVQGELKATAKKAVANRSADLVTEVRKLADSIRKLGQAMKAFGE